MLEPDKLTTEEALGSVEVLEGHRYSKHGQVMEDDEVQQHRYK
jgi:hypothetical protein